MGCWQLILPLAFIWRYAMAISGLLMIALLVCGGGVLIAAIATAVYFYLRDKEA